MNNASLTGYPSVDKPWLKFFPEKAINAPAPEGSLHEYMYAQNKDYPNQVALNYFGNKVINRNREKTEAHSHA